MRIVTFFLLVLGLNTVYGQTAYQKDFDYYWNTINDNFGYFDTQKTDWKKVRSIYQPIADTITNTSSFISFLETVNNELYNGHISLNSNLPSSSRLIPTGADLWVEYKNKHFIITAKRKDFNADMCGLKTGMIITRVNDIIIDSAILRFLPKSVLNYDKKMYEYAANLLLAGRHNEKRKISVLLNGVEKNFYPDSITNKTETGFETILDYKTISSQVGYIKINNSLGDFDLIKSFDKALDNLWNTQGLIIDLRETPSGGNSTVARAILSRFIENELPYQKHCLPAEEKQSGIKRSWIELVSSRGKIYKKSLVVLVNRWTGSMGEGIAIGFDGMKRAYIVGDKMAGLLGAIYSFNLPESRIGFSFPVEKLFHVTGLPREQFVPKFLETDNEKCIATALKLITSQKK